MEWIFEPWPWYIGGPLIGSVILLTKFWGKRLGISSTFRATCTIAGAGKKHDYFNIDWKKDLKWMLIMVGGLVIGGYIANSMLSTSTKVPLSQEAIEVFEGYGINDPGKEFLPREIYSLEGLATVPGFIIIILGGFLVGFGARYAGGCTSGHAMSGLSEFQLPSLLAVIGFFIGGLITSHLLLPAIF